MKSSNILVLLSSLWFASSVSYAAAMKKGPPMGAFNQSGSSKSSGRDWLISLPIMSERPQMRLHVEYNAQRSLGLAIEAAAIAKTEELHDDEINLTGNSLSVNGVQGSMLMSRYSDEANMGGFFWAIGAGYRRWNAEWKKKPDKKESLRMGLVDNDGYLHHRVEGKGVTGHLRGGYRYVASEWPLAIGAHLGLRHMNSQVTDKKVSESEEKQLGLAYSELNDNERKHLRHRMMTTPDFTVDFGVVF